MHSTAERLGDQKGYAVECHYRNQKLLDIGEGKSEVQRIVIARNIGVSGRTMWDYARVPCAIHSG
jgi:hypothetical protein